MCCKYILFVCSLFLPSDISLFLSQIKFFCKRSPSRYLTLCKFGNLVVFLLGTIKYVCYALSKQFKLSGARLFITLFLQLLHKVFLFGLLFYSTSAIISFSECGIVLMHARFPIMASVSNMWSYHTGKVKVDPSFSASNYPKFRWTVIIYVTFLKPAWTPYLKMCLYWPLWYSSRPLQNWSSPVNKLGERESMTFADFKASAWDNEVPT